MKVKSEKGFFIGDPCYVLSDDVYRVIDSLYKICIYKLVYV